MTSRNTRTYTADRLVALAAFEDANEDVETLTVSLPEDLSALSADEVNELRTTIVDAYAELRAGGDTSDATIETLEALAEMRVAVDANIAARASVAADRAARLAALDATMNPAPVAEAPEDEADEDAEENEDAEEDADEADAEDVVETSDVDAEAAEAEVVAEAEAILVDAETPELVTASGEEQAPVTTFQRGPISVPRLRSRQTPQEETPVTTPRSAFRAAVNVPGLIPNAEMNLSEVSMAFAEMVERAGRAGGAKGVKAGARFSDRHQIAQIVKEFDPRAVVGDDNDADAALAFATRGEAIEAMVAAGGWCAPSETSYDLCELESREGILSIPEINLRRGGLRFTQGPDWADIFANTGFAFTEAEDIEGNYDGAESGPSPKPCDVVPCPTFTDVRLDAAGVCISAGNLMNRAYPELVRRYVSGAITAHYHRVATDVITRIVAQSTAVSPTSLGTTNSSGTANLLSAVELQAEDIRYRRRMSRNAVLEVILPFWARGVMRADVSRRRNGDLGVADSEIAEWFRVRNLAPQYIYNWQNLGAPAAATAWPGSVQFLIFPAGTFVKGASDLITIEMLRDSTLNAENNFTAIFTEEAYNVMKFCPESRIVTVENFCPAGWTNLGTAVACA